MYQVKYEMPEAQTSLEYILEQVIHGAEIIIVRHGIEVARITAAQGLSKGATTVMSTPYEQR
ncbi:type II toxin-antitoxin system Phd/YefM family antitoxin [Pseudomonas sp. UFMG81]|uniref:type II toxin-antitoxin system Phd/YefM family antitoxin n=1 Tax=Pseudomonas sp. UFMG81 TaxID=2745936 RepID=UPI00188FD73B|nr:hypothetical protein [Pseudomonas sp. UFMG81]